MPKKHLWALFPTPKDDSRCPNNLQRLHSLSQNNRISSPILASSYLQL